MDDLNQAIFDSLEESESLIPRQRKLEPEKHYSLDKTHSYQQELIANTEPFLKWDNNTYFNDRKRLYALGMAVLSKKGESSLVSILRWCKDRRVHVRACLKVLTKALTNQK